MKWFGLVALGLGACSFSSGNGPGDASIEDDARIDAPGTTCSPGFLDLCSQPDATDSLVIRGDETIDTDSDPRCRSVLQDTREICLVYATEVSIASGATLRGIGSKPLAIASVTTLTITGTLDVSSSRLTGQIGAAADDAACTFVQLPESDLGGAGGGAGGSLGAVGGDGGTGDSDDSLGPDDTAAPGRPGPALTAVALRGGCRGQAGASESAATNPGGPGGHAGGALYLHAAQAVRVSGRIRATGAGGEGGKSQAGGGGGGSGGAIVIESPAIMIAGSISANGGGGGMGGVRYSGPPSADVPGEPGLDGGDGELGAAGGTRDGDPRLGFGGLGGATSPTMGTNGTSSIVGAGGGGGGAGVITLIGARMISGVVSPAPQ